MLPAKSVQTHKKTKTKQKISYQSLKTWAKVGSVSSRNILKERNAGVKRRKINFYIIFCCSALWRRLFPRSLLPVMEPASWSFKSTWTAAGSLYPDVLCWLRVHFASLVIPPLGCSGFWKAADRGRGGDQEQPGRAWVAAGGPPWTEVTPYSDVCFRLGHPAVEISPLINSKCCNWQYLKYGWSSNGKTKTKVKFNRQYVTANIN